MLLYMAGPGKKRDESYADLAFTSQALEIHHTGSFLTLMLENCR